MVYRGRQLSTGQEVAIKCLRRGRTESEDERYVARFHRETALCAQLHHPNIVRLIDAGQTVDSAGSLLYTVFELLPGKTVADVLVAEGRIAPVELGYLMGQVLDALSCAHEHGIVHRDLKPSNLMLVLTGARRNAMVLDFGIGALTRDAELQGYTDLTATREQICTPAYCAPEQLRGRSAEPASDLYAWGLVFIECLTGRRMFVARTVEEVIHEQLSCNPVPIPDALAGHPLAALLELVTRKDHTNRRISARQALARLEACDLGSVDTVRLAIEPEPALPASLDEAATRTVAPLSVDSNSHLGAPSPLLTDERRQVTVVSCSLYAIPATGPATPDPDMDVEELQEHMRDEVIAVVEFARDRAGHVLCETNNRVLLYFGFPRAHADDARRAVDAATELCELIKQKNVVSSRSSRMSIDVRMAVHTGLIVARSSPDGVEIVGETPAVAAQLDRYAEPMQVVISESTQALVRTQIACTNPRVCRVGANRVMTIFMARGPLATSDASLRSTPLIGRESELSMLERSLERTRDGHGAAVLIVGETGVGKSRLIQELYSRTRDARTRWLECRCSPDSTNSMLRPIIGLFERELGFHAESDPAGKTRKLAAYLERYGLDQGELMPLLAPLLEVPLEPPLAPLDVGPEWRKELTLSALITVFATLAADEPLIIAIEDAHWADATTTELISFLLDEAQTTAMLLLITARPELEVAWRPSHLAWLRIERLNTAAGRALIEHVTGGAALPEEVVDAVLQRSDGIPLFVKELTRAVIESSALVRRGDYYALSGALADLAIPATLRDLLTARLDHLGPAKHVAQIAAIFGREVALDQLCAVLESEPVAVCAAMERVVEADLAYHSRSRGEKYVFRHSLIREAAYDSVSMRVRRDYHGRIARLLSERFPALAAARPDLLAQHYAGAGELEAAFEHGLLAARTALGCSAQPGSSVEAERELSCYNVIVAALLATTGYGQGEFETITARALEISVLVGDSQQMFSAYSGIFAYHFVRAEHEQAAAVSARYLALAERGTQLGPRLMGHAYMGSAHFYAGELVWPAPSSSARLRSMIQARRAPSATAARLRYQRIRAVVTKRS